MSITVHEGDCRDVLFRLRRDKLLVDAVVTDPPYALESIQKRFGGKDSAPAGFGRDGFFARSSKDWIGQAWDTDVAFDPATWRAIRRVMKPGAFLFAFASPLTGHRQMTAIEAAGFKPFPFIGWAFSTGAPKPHPIGDGSFFGTGTIRPALEPIYVAQNPISERTYAENVRRWGVGAFHIAETKAFAQASRWPTNLILDGSLVVDQVFPAVDTFMRLIHHPKASAADKAGSSHPTVKPISLLEVLICLSTPVGGVVLDSFAGSGATGVAADNMGCSSVLIEQDSAYAEALRSRFAPRRRRIVV